MRKLLLYFTASLAVTAYFFHGGYIAGHRNAYSEMQHATICTIENGQARAMSYQEFKSRVHLNSKQ